MRRTLLFLLLLCLGLSPVQAAADAGTGYSDVSEADWFCTSVQYVSERSLMQGDGAGRFLPEQAMTRAMVVTVLHRMACVPDSNLQNSFSDVYDSHYASMAIRWACENGITSGVTKDRFAPNSIITREQAVVFFYRYAKTMRLNPVGPAHLLTFSDAEEISDYARQAVAWAVKVGILQGGTNAMNPKAAATRAEIAAMVMRYQQWAEPRSAVRIMPGEIVSLFGQRVRGVRSGGKLHVPAHSAEASTATAKYRKMINNIQYLRLDYYTEVQGCVEGVTPSGMRYIAKNEPLAQPKAGTEVPVLMYHAVSDDIWGMEELFVGPEMMEEQLKYLVDNGYDPIWFEDLEDLSQYDKPVILTFDDGYLDNYTTLYPLLRKYQVKATFFIIGETVGWESKMNWSQLYEVSHSGLVSVQSHTYNHNPLDEMSAKQQEYEMQAGQAVVAAITGKVSRILCYPGGRHNAATLQLAPRYYDFALKWDGGMYTTGDHPYAINRFYVARSTQLNEFQAFLN